MCKPIAFKIWYLFEIPANYPHKINVYKTFLYTTVHLFLTTISLVSKKGYHL